MKRVALVLLCGTILGIMAWALWPAAEEQAMAPAATPLAPSAVSGSHLPVLSEAVVVPELPRDDSPLLPPAQLPVADAVASLSQSREAGDGRAPPVLRSEAAAEAPSAAELADPKAYQQYEARQNQRLYKAYLQAADSEIPRLQEDIQHARNGGLSPEAVAEGEEKLRRIQAMRDQLAADQPGSLL